MISSTLSIDETVSNPLEEILLRFLIIGYLLVCITKKCYPKFLRLLCQCRTSQCFLDEEGSIKSDPDYE